MTSAESAKLAKVAQDLVRWIQNQALDGIGPLPSASDLADYYKRQSYANDAARVQGLITWAVAKNTATGFVAGLGGLLTLPVAIPGSLAASLAIQASMVAAIAEIYGHDSKNDQVRTAILLCMIGIAIEDVAKQAGVTLGGRFALEALKNVPGKVLIEINKRVGFRLLTKFGERGVVNLAKLVPLVGGAVGGAFDGATCYMVGQAAARAFRPTAAEHGMDAETWERALDSYRYPVDLTCFRDAQKHPGWFDLKISGRLVRTTLRIPILRRSEPSDASCSSNRWWQPQPRSPRSFVPTDSRWWTRRSRDGQARTAVRTATPRLGVPILNVCQRCGPEPFSENATGGSSNRGSLGVNSPRGY